MMRRSATILAALAMTGGATGKEPPVTLNASMPADASGVVLMQVSVEIGEGWSASAAGIPKPLLQLDPGEGAKLEGKVLEGRAQARNEYLFAPFERAVDPGSTQVPMQVVDQNKSIGVNLVAYVRKEGDDKAYFVRRRVELPLVAGSTASSSSAATKSTWGPADRQALSIGQKAPDFALPKADGSSVQLSSYLGESDVIVTTYRAYW